MIADADDLKHNRLWNWGRWARPDLSILGYALMWDLMPMGRDERESAEATEDTERVEHESYTSGEQEINADDAEIMDTWIRQLPAEHKANLARRYILRQTVGRELIDAACRAILELMDANRVVVRKMEMYR